MKMNPKPSKVVNETIAVLEEAQVSVWSILGKGV